MHSVKKYDIWLVDLNPIKGSEQSGIRPCVIVQNDTFFEYQGTTLILPITSNIKKDSLFGVYLKDYKQYGLQKPSFVLSFQLRTIDKSRCIKKLGVIHDNELRKQISQTILLSLDIEDQFLEL